MILKKYILLSLANLFLISFSFAQKSIGKIDVEYIFKDRGEVYFKFKIKDKSELNLLTKIISIDNVKANDVFAYANKNEFVKFVNLNYDFDVLKPPSEDVEVLMLDWNQIQKSKSWDYYPTYPAYDSMMQKFASDYPALCTLVNIGTLYSGRKLLALKISDSVNIKEAEPQFLYTSSIHGNELTGYVLMLRFIDYLLSNYGQNPRITNLINNSEIWINPLANPDGTYAGGNHTVNGATRYNAANIDLNRNYPDPEDGPHPDNNAWQEETQFFMNFATNQNFVMAVNFHGGAEVLNYPWDTWAKLHADDNWWKYVCREYTDTAQYFSPSGYLDDQNNGITNGYQWYSISGGRQDYMNYFHHCRELTLEISNAFICPENQLNNFWNYNYRSLLNYAEQVLYGVKGIVTDSVTGLPLEAKVFISGHDIDSSHIYSSLPIGNYNRPLYAGNYSLTFSKPGYKSKTIQNISVTNRSVVNLDVQLATAGPDGKSEVSINKEIRIFPNPSSGAYKIEIDNIQDKAVLYKILSISGQLMMEGFIESNRSKIDLKRFDNGVYIIEIEMDDSIFIDKLIKL
ncbi:MAG: T9SS type A sorting domain-containing protein [Saprospiraceae bacterium]|nr:T9SS type A sorting domain-containing protein [Saprospiraceae bacterium]